MHGSVMSKINVNLRAILKIVMKGPIFFFLALSVKQIPGNPDPHTVVLKVKLTGSSKS